MPRLYHKFSENEYNHAAFFLMSGWQQLLKRAGDRAGRYRWSMEHLEGAKPSKAGEKGFKLSGGGGCFLEKGIWLLSKGRQKKVRDRKRKTGHTHDLLLPVYIFWLGQPKNKGVREKSSMLAIQSSHSQDPELKSQTTSKRNWCQRGNFHWLAKKPNPNLYCFL